METPAIGQRESTALPMSPRRCTRVTANATWPQSFNTASPMVTPWVYEVKMRGVKKTDLGAAWKEMCLAQ